MISFVFFITAFVYSIFFLGLAGFFYPVLIQITGFFYLVAFLLYLTFVTKIKLENVMHTSIDLPSKTFIVFLVCMVLVNMIGMLGPELAFDALWYHLTLPKIYLLQHHISVIPGGLLYYSAMPQYGEMLYAISGALQTEIIAKGIHFSFGLLTCLLTYWVARTYLPRTFALLAVLIFYSNLVVAWESITAYIDLIRTFFEIGAFYYFLHWLKNKKEKMFLVSAFFLGCAIATKLLAVGSLLFFVGIILYRGYVEKPRRFFVKRVFQYVSIALVVPLPWFIYSYYYTGNPVSPFFTPLYPTQITSQLGNPFVFLKDIIELFTRLADPISPLYAIVVPLLIVYRKILVKKIPVLLIYTACAILLWYITPQTGGGRFILPYLPAFSVIASTAIFLTKGKWIQRGLLTITIVIACITIGYRGIANMKYVPHLLGLESKSQFLSSHLNFAFGDFYDSDGYFAKTIMQKDKVLLIGFHSLYYVNFPFVDSSFVKKGDRFNYIAIQHSDFPKRFMDGLKVYENKMTKVTVYKKSKGGVWEY